jgi:hypothetical protein
MLLVPWRTRVRTVECFVLEKGRFAMNETKWWTRLIPAVSLAALLSGMVANVAHADPGACAPVKVCAPVKEIAPLPPACKPVKVFAPLPPACKPVKIITPPPAACQPVKAYAPVRQHLVNLVTLPVRIVYAVHVALVGGHGAVEDGYVVPQATPAPSSTTPALAPLAPLAPPTPPAPTPKAA